MPTLASGGGPAINTGNAAWDQGLGSIFGAMSEGPAKIAQAGYYGAEQRYKQLQSAQLQEQLAAGHQYLGMMTGQMPGKPQYRTDPATGQNILADTAAVWGGSGGPAPAPPAAPPGPPPISSAVVGSPPGQPPGPAAAPPAPPPAPAPIVAGQVGANMAPSDLGALVAGGGGAVPPVLSAQNAAATGDAVVNAVDSHPGAPGPAVSSPAPSAPPAPNTTASDGSVPPSTDHSVVHPGTFTPAGGGVKGAPPAAPDGSPAPPMLNLGQFAALATLKGMPAADALALGRMIVAGWVKNGQMDSVTADNVVANIGEPAMRTAGINNAGALQRTNVEQAGQTQRQGMVTGETAREFNEAIIQTVNPADPNGPPIPVMRKDLKPGMQEWSQPLASQNVVTNENRRQFNEAIVQVVNPADPNGPPIAMKRSDMKPGMQEWNQGVATQRGGPVVVNKPGVGPVNTTLSEAVTSGPNQPTSYQPGTADIQQTQGGTYGTFVDPNDADPTHARTMTTAEAATKGWIPYGTMTPKEPMKPQESFQQNALAHGIDQEIYQQPQKGSLTSPGYVDAPVVFSPAGQAKIQALETRFLRDPATRGDPGKAHRLAVEALQKSGDLPSATQVAALRNAGGVISTAGGRATDPRLSVSPSYDGKGTTTPHLWVGLKGEQNPNDPGAPTAFNPEPGPRAGSNVTPQTPPGPRQPQPQPQAAPVATAPLPPPSAGAGKSAAPPRLSSSIPVAPPAPPIPPRIPGAPPGTEARQPGGAAATALPSGVIGRAAPGARDGTIQYDTAGRPAGVVRGGLVYQMPAMAGGSG